MKPLLLVFFCAFVFLTVKAQVGIGTTNPDASSILDISATDKGILIPRVSLNNVTITQLDGVNTAASGLLIWNTNAATIGGSGIGFYYFNGLTLMWERLITSNTILNDHDFYEVSTTNAPNDISDDIYKLGSLAIGSVSGAAHKFSVSDNSAETGLASFQLTTTATNTTITGATNTVNMQNTSGTVTVEAFRNSIIGTGDGNHSAIRNMYTNSGVGAKTGLRNDIPDTAGSGSRIGVANALASNDASSVTGINNFLQGGNSSATTIGIHTQIYSGDGTNHATYNELTGTGSGTHYGTRQAISNSGNGIHFAFHNTVSGLGSGDHYGSYSLLSGIGTGNQYGARQRISNTGTGSHYGSFNELSGSGSGTKYGSYNFIDSPAGGTHFGVYSEVLKSGGFAGYFRGDVAIGTTSPTNPTPDFYLLPPSRGTVNQIIQTNGTGITSWVDNPAIVTAQNGLTETASVVRLGGVLTQNTTISNGAFNFDIDLTDLGDFHIQDSGINHFSVESAGDINFGGDVYWRDESTTGTVLASLVDDGNDGRFRIYENGLPSIDLDSNGTSVINEQGFDRDFRIESEDNPLAFGVNGGENVMFAGANTLSLTNNGATVNGVTLEYVASFYRDDLTNGTAIQLGSTEYITDFGDLMIGPYGSWAPYSDNTFDLGTSTFRWDDVYATSGVVNTSDIRLKRNIKDLSYGLNEVMKLEPISYQWKNSRNPSEVKIGFSAQQLLTVLPEVVKTQDFVYPDEKGPGVLQNNENLGVYYSDIIPVLTKAIQEQQAIILSLKQRIETLENKN